ncbi:MULTISPECIES: MXAN_6640 family putative metalloprotease [Nocardioides]|uniref:MXAN_6640 family putative metalloprotease n=1 Tax=Nocardioides vastitatis TaxID=2568655 RepID=A0ABW0ZJD1_9ACTN|nr:MXAN_6640 family putative metalloprotease [Nocardioides sp.]THJ07352.1 hypothetical protein E7Z54_05525 [Nocardioides sp.]
MTSRSHSRLPGLLLTFLATLLLVPFLGVAAQAEPGEPADPSSPSATATPQDPQEIAEQALETVEDLLEGAPTPSDPSHTGEPPRQDLTIAIRDLAANQRHLPKAKRDDAARILARPDDGPAAACDPRQDPICYSQEDATECNASMCVHFVSSGVHRASVAYAQHVLRTVTGIAHRYRAAGYRSPMPDGDAGGNIDKFDVYLGDLGSAGFYGYCNTDTPEETRHIGVPAYCVFDNDYRPGQYPAHTPEQNLRVTAAHEYFHAVQFAYDYLEDGWLMEATATWIEDEVYDGVNDNRYYLSHGPLGNPQVPVDRHRGLSAYGSWIFVRYLSERYPPEVGGLPVIVRQIWRQALGARYSVQAIRSVLSAKGTDLTTQFGRFTTWNRRPWASYTEGRAYKAAPLHGSYLLRPGARTKRLDIGLNHLAAKHYRYRPSSDMAAGWRLRLRLNLNGRISGGAAFVTVKPDGRAPYVRRVSLNRYGNRTVSFPFGRARVDWVEVTVVNASARYRCNLGLGWDDTCEGRSLDDGARQLVAARAYRP